MGQIGGTGRADIADTYLGVVDNVAASAIEGATGDVQFAEFVGRYSEVPGDNEAPQLRFMVLFGGQVYVDVFHHH